MWDRGWTASTEFTSPLEQRGHVTSSMLFRVSPPWFVFVQWEEYNPHHKPVRSKDCIVTILQTASECLSPAWVTQQRSWSLQGYIRCTVSHINAERPSLALSLHYCTPYSPCKDRTRTCSQTRSALMIPFRKILSKAGSWWKEAHTAAWLGAPQSPSDNCISKQCGFRHQ